MLKKIIISIFLILFITTIHSENVLSKKQLQYGNKQVDELIKEEYYKLAQILKDTTISDNIKADKIHQLADKRIDFELITKLCIGKQHWRTLTDRQKDLLNTHFKVYLKSFYTQLSIENSDKEVVFFPSIQKNNKITISIIIDKTINLKYKLYDKNNTWKIYDLEIDGISLIRTYQMQFNVYLNKMNQILKAEFKALGPNYQEIYEQLLSKNIFKEDTKKTVRLVKSKQSLNKRLDFLDKENKKIILQLISESQSHFNLLIQSLK